VKLKDALSFLNPIVVISEKMIMQVLKEYCEIVQLIKVSIYLPKS